MITVVTDNRVKEREAYLPLAKAFAKDVLLEKGCQSMEVLRDTEAEDRVVYLSRWDSKADFEAHIQGKAFEKHIPKMAPYYISGTDTFLESVD